MSHFISPIHVSEKREIFEKIYGGTKLQ